MSRSQCLPTLQLPRVLTNLDRMHAGYYSADINDVPQYCRHFYIDGTLKRRMVQKNYDIVQERMANTAKVSGSKEKITLTMDNGKTDAASGIRPLSCCVSTIHTESARFYPGELSSLPKQGVLDFAVDAS